jgi:exopolyphosphatase/guanosine-5'-triphosphate,3'-diphosphate pyrophosphatase
MHACIDLGSNSFHLLIGEWEQGRIRIIERLSEKVQLGENVRSSGEISPQAFARGIACLKRFKSLMDQYPLENYWALGTNTFRVTRNADEFLAAAEQIGIHISIISGVQEAVLIYAGVITGLPVSDANRLVIDIGGGSTEIIIGRHHDRPFTESLAIGSVAWRDRFFSEASKDTSTLLQQMEKGRLAARAVFDVSAPGLKKIGWDEAYASSGTMKMLSQISAGAGFAYGKLKLKALYKLQEQMAHCIASDGDMTGLKVSRRDLLLPGWCVLVGLMESYGVRKITFSPTALREGMLDFMVKNEKTLEAMTSSELPQTRPVQNPVSDN